MKRYNLITAGILLLTIALLAGCSPSALKAPAGAQPAPVLSGPASGAGEAGAAQPAAPPPASSQPNTPATPNPAKSSPTSSGIDAKLTAGGALGIAKFSPSQGQKLRLALELKNNVAAMTIMYASGQSYDFWVEQSGKEVWRWSDGQMFTQALVSQTFNAGGVLRFEEEWDGTDKSGKKVAPGTYMLHASWRAQTELSSTPQPAPIQIVVE